MHHQSATCVTSAISAVKHNGTQLKEGIAVYNGHMKKLADSLFIREMGKLRGSIIN